MGARESWRRRRSVGSASALVRGIDGDAGRQGSGYDDWPASPVSQRRQGETPIGRATANAGREDSSDNVEAEGNEEQDYGSHEGEKRRKEKERDQ